MFKTRLEKATMDNYLMHEHGRRRSDGRIISQKVKKTLTVTCFLLWIIGGLFAAVGGWGISQVARHVLLTFATVPGSVFATSGCIIFIASSLGVLGTKRENVTHLKIYRNLLIFVLVIELLSGLLAFAFWSEIKKIIHVNISNGIKHYTEKGDLPAMIDELQRDFECCGSLSYDDWDSNPHFNCRNTGSYRSCGVPWSCCTDRYGENRQCGFGTRRNRITIDSHVYTIGCLDKLFEFTKRSMFLIGGLAIGCNFLVILGIILSNRLIKQINRLIALFYIDYGKVHL